MIRKLTVAVLLFGLCAPALATDWYLFEVQSQKCENAVEFAARQHAPMYASPYDMRLFMRQMFPDTYGGTSVLHFPQGGRMVEIKNGQRALYYFSSKATCLNAYKIMREKHLVPNLNELK